MTATATYDYSDLRSRIIYEACRPVLVQYHCSVCDSLFNVESEKFRQAYSGSLEMRLGGGCSPLFESLTHYATFIDPAVAPEYREVRAVACPNCGSVGDGSTRPTKRVITGRMSGDACDDICAEATGNTCSCQCGGLRHGVNGRG